MYFSVNQESTNSLVATRACSIDVNGGRSLLFCYCSFILHILRLDKDSSTSPAPNMKVSFHIRRTKFFFYKLGVQILENRGNVVSVAETCKQLKMTLN